MLLTLPLRLTALHLLPAEGTFLTLRTVRDAQHALSPSAEEIERFQIQQEGTSVRWVGDTTADVPLSSAAVALLRTALEERNTAGTCTMAHVDLSDALSDASSDVLAAP